RDPDAGGRRADAPLAAPGRGRRRRLPRGRAAADLDVGAVLGGPVLLVVGAAVRCPGGADVVSANPFRRLSWRLPRAPVVVGSSRSSSRSAAPSPAAGGPARRWAPG